MAMEEGRITPGLCILRYQPTMKTEMCLKLSCDFLHYSQFGAVHIRYRDTVIRNKVLVQMYLGLGRPSGIQGMRDIGGK
jgi:hypothetical protein